MNQWWIIIDGEHRGPYTSQEIETDFHQYPSGVSFILKRKEKSYSFESVEEFQEVDQAFQDQSQSSDSYYQSLSDHSNWLIKFLNALSYVCLILGGLSVIFGFYEITLVLKELNKVGTEDEVTLGLMLTLGTYVIVVFAFMVVYAILRFLAHFLSIQIAILRKSDPSEKFT